MMEQVAALGCIALLFARLIGLARWDPPPYPGQALLDAAQPMVVIHERANLDRHADGLTG
jgi:hypothetical protein